MWYLIAFTAVITLMFIGFVIFGEVESSRSNCVETTRSGCRYPNRNIPKYKCRSFDEIESTKPYIVSGNRQEYEGIANDSIVYVEQITSITKKGSIDGHPVLMFTAGKRGTRTVLGKLVGYFSASRNDSYLGIHSQLKDEMKKRGLDADHFTTKMKIFVEESGFKFQEDDPYYGQHLYVLAEEQDQFEPKERHFSVYPVESVIGRVRYVTKKTNEADQNPEEK